VLSFALFGIKLPIILSESTCFPPPKYPKIGKNTELCIFRDAFLEKKVFNFGKIANSSWSLFPFPVF